MKIKWRKIINFKPLDFEINILKVKIPSLNKTWVGVVLVSSNGTAAAYIRNPDMTCNWYYPKTTFNFSSVVEAKQRIKKELLKEMEKINDNF